MEDKQGLESSDFIVRVRPDLNEEGVWTGGVDIAVITSEGNEINDDDYGQLMHFCKMLASCVPIMEFNEDIRELAHNFVEEKLDIVEERGYGSIVGRDDNVISINFGTNTKGSA
jgi:acyl-coenzyme A synthetase/AMP-(fatty) acid ligase|tara:strand:+ start:8458 stop:8799 length:342 start_codon:yes stop_codon:yes gene_type:complete